MLAKLPSPNKARSVHDPSIWLRRISTFTHVVRAACCLFAVRLCMQPKRHACLASSMPSRSGTKLLDLSIISILSCAGGPY